MDRIPEIVPISALRLRQTEVLKKLVSGPVVLTQHGKAVAVMVDPEAWNRITEELGLLADSVDALEAKLALLEGKEGTVPWEEVEAELNVSA